MYMWTAECGLFFPTNSTHVTPIVALVLHLPLISPIPLPPEGRETTFPYGNAGETLAPTSSVANDTAPGLSPPTMLVLLILPATPSPRPDTIRDPPRLAVPPRSSSLVDEAEKFIDVSFSGRFGPPEF